MRAECVVDSLVARSLSCTDVNLVWWASMFALAHKALHYLAAALVLLAGVHCGCAPCFSDTETAGAPVALAHDCCRHSDAGLPAGDSSPVQHSSHHLASSCMTYADA